MIFDISDMESASSMKTPIKLFLYILILLSTISLYACSGDNEEMTGTPTDSATTIVGTTVVFTLDQEGFFLVTEGKTDRLLPGHLSMSQSIDISNLVNAYDPIPTFFLNLGDIDTNMLYLRSMTGGIGIDFNRDDEAGGMYVNSVRPGYGAETAGIKRGDVILAADRQSFSDLFNYQNYFDKIGELITGELGSQVTLTVMRNGEELEIEVNRNFPTIPPNDDQIRYQQEYHQSGVIQLTPEEYLAEGLYCFQHVKNRTQLGDFYCFISGDLAVTGPQVPTNIEKKIPTQKARVSGDSFFEYTDCRIPTLLGQDVTCGDLFVPENRDQPEGNTIQLHVAIFNPGGSVQPDPVIYMHGGPGAGILDGIADSYMAGIRYLFPEREFIVFDQRGTGYASPRLECPSLAGDYVLSLSEDQRMGLHEWTAGQMEMCITDLFEKNIDLSAYTSRSSAADINDLIKLLGYEKVNFFGSSYGSYLAFTYMDEFGTEDHIRSVVLETVYPLHVDLFADRATNAQRSLDAIFYACANDPSCHNSYPDLENVFYNLLERFNEEPITINAINPLTLEDQDVVINSYRFLETIYRASYHSDWIPHLPKMLYEMQADNYGLFTLALDNVFYLSSGIDDGLYYAILCNDEGSFSSSLDIETGSAGLHPIVRSYFDGGSLSMLEVCSNWDSGPLAPDQNQAVVSNVPTLLLSGSYDPITPPTWGHLAAETLSHGYAYEFPNAAHGILSTSRCAQEITATFLQNPQKPTLSCLENLPGIVFEEH
jgi:pimeloyl-ACP methyl ester carboxylesterase